MATPPKNSIYSDEVQNLLLENNTLGNEVGENAWSLDRSTPVSALKNMIREYYTPNTSLDNKTAKAVVLQIGEKIPSFFETIEGPAASSKTQLVRIQVISDLRTFWIPVPKNSEDPVIGLYPLVKNETGQPLSVGDLIQVEFHNNKNQFSSITDVGFVNKKIAKIESPYLEPLIERKRTTLPSTAEIKNKKAVSLKIDPKDTSAGKKGQELINDRSFNQKAANVAKRLGVDKQILLDIMEFESQVNPQATNKSSNGKRYATGLIQFVPDTAVSLKTTVDDLYNMTGYQQLDLVEDYFISKGAGNTRKAGKDIKDLYLLVIYPRALHRPDSYIIGYFNGKDQRANAASRAKYKTSSFAKVFAFQNPIFKQYLIPPGVVTRAAVRRKISEWMVARKRDGSKFTDPHAQVYK